MYTYARALLVAWHDQANAARMPSMGSLICLRVESRMEEENVCTLFGQGHAAQKVCRPAMYRIGEVCEAGDMKRARQCYAAKAQQDMCRHVCTQ